MGLDITHFKATFKKPQIHTLWEIQNGIISDSGGYTENDFTGFNVTFSHFEKYIHLIDSPTAIDTVVIVKNENHLSKAQDHFADYNHIILDGTIQTKLQKELEAYEKLKGYENLEKNFRDIPGADWTILTYYTLSKKEGFYFESVGEQRKGMSELFWKKFCQGESSNFALKSDFEFAKNCLSTPNTLSGQLFKEDFLDSFELGTSFMSVSF